MLTKSLLAQACPSVGRLIYLSYTDSSSKVINISHHFVLRKVSCNPFPEIPPIHVHSDGVSQLLHNLKPREAAGPDNLPSYFLKEVAYEISPALLFITF